MCFSVRSTLVLFGCLVIAVTGARADTVPFVGCAVDGQVGPLAPPTEAASTLDLPPAIAAKLAYYASANIWVLGPRGWHCFGLYGSNGEKLFLTPEPHDSRDILSGSGRLVGPAIEYSNSVGGTSGRFEVAKVAARLFPVAKPFVEKVAAEGLEPKGDFVLAPFPADRLTRVSDTVVEYVTPAGTDGMGTVSYLQKNGLPISGVAALAMDDPSEIDLGKLDVRLPPEMQDLVPAILHNRPEPGGSRG